MTETKSISISVHSPSKSDIKSMNGNTRAMDKNSSPRASLLRNKSEVQLKSNSLLDKYFNRKDHMDQIKRLLKETWIATSMLLKFMLLQMLHMLVEVKKQAYIIFQNQPLLEFLLLQAISSKNFKKLEIQLLKKE